MLRNQKGDGEAMAKNKLTSCKSIFLTGASGFIGSRIVERLVLEYNQHPACLIHNPAHMARIARFPTRAVFGDVMAPETFRDKIRGCDVYIHTAYGKEATKEKNWKINVKGTENLLKLAVENKIKHFIFISSIAVYEEQFSHGRLDEKIIPVCKEKDYAGAKLRAEEICFEYYHKYNLPITILRPSIVYGPFASSWTIGPYVNIKNGTLRRYIDFNGICNAVYIDDLVSVIIECICNESAYGEIFNVAGEDKITWNEFFDFYSKVVLGIPLPEAPYRTYLLRYYINSNARKVAKFMLNKMPGLTKSIYRTLRDKRIRAVDYIVKIREYSPEQLKFFTKTLVYPVDKLKDKLGHKDRFSFAKGTLLTAEWLKDCNY